MKAFRKTVILLLASTLAFASLFDCNKKEDDDQEDLQTQLINSSLAATYSCSLIASSSQCINMVKFSQLVAQGLCDGWKGTLSAKDLKCAQANSLGACSVQSSSTLPLEEGQSVQVVYYNANAAGGSPLANSDAAKILCEDVNNPLRGIFTATYAP